MIVYYGIGCNYGNGEYSNEFYENDMICIASNNPERIYFIGMFDNIRNGDIAFIKTIKRTAPRILKII